MRLLGWFLTGVSLLARLAAGSGSSGLPSIRFPSSENRSVQELIETLKDKQESSTLFSLWGKFQKGNAFICSPKTPPTNVHAQMIEILNGNSVLKETFVSLNQSLAEHSYKAAAAKYRIEALDDVAFLYPFTNAAKEILLRIISYHSDAYQFGMAAEYARALRQQFPLSELQPGNLLRLWFVYSSVGNTKEASEIEEKVHTFPELETKLRHLKTRLPKKQDRDWVSWIFSAKPHQRAWFRRLLRLGTVDAATLFQPYVENGFRKGKNWHILFTLSEKGSDIQDSMDFVTNNPKCVLLELDENLAEDLGEKGNAWASVMVSGNSTLEACGVLLSEAIRKATGNTQLDLYSVLSRDCPKASEAHKLFLEDLHADDYERVLMAWSALEQNMHKPGAPVQELASAAESILLHRALGRMSMDIDEMKMREDQVFRVAANYVGQYAGLEPRLIQLADQLLRSEAHLSIHSNILAGIENAVTDKADIPQGLVPVLKFLGSRDKTVNQVAALRCLAYVPGEGSDFVLDMVISESPEKVTAATSALTFSHTEAIRKGLIARYNIPRLSAEHRADIIGLLGTHIYHTEDLVSTMNKALEDEDGKVVATALQAFGNWFQTECETKKMDEKFSYPYDKLARFLRDPRLVVYEAAIRPWLTSNELYDVLYERRSGPAAYSAEIILRTRDAARDRMSRARWIPLPPL